MKVMRKDLLDAIDKIKAGIADDDAVAQADSIYFNGTSMIAFNDDVMVEVPMAIPVVGVVKADKFIDLIKKIKVDEIDVDVVDGEMRIKAKRVVSGLTLESEVKMGYASAGKPEKWYPIPKSMFEGLKMCAMTAAQDTVVLLLNCVRIKGRIIESCDRFRLTRWKMDKEAEQVFEDQILIPARSAAILSKYGLKELGFVIRKKKAESWIHFRGDGITLACHLFGGDYPDLSKFAVTGKVEIDFPDGLADALQKATVFAEIEETKTRIMRNVEIEWRPGSVLVRAETTGGWIAEKLPAKYDGDPKKIKGDVDLLMYAIKEHKQAVVDDKFLELRGERYAHLVLLSKTKETGSEEDKE